MQGIGTYSVDAEVQAGLAYDVRQEGQGAGDRHGLSSADYNQYQGRPAVVVAVVVAAVDTQAPVQAEGQAWSRYYAGTWQWCWYTRCIQPRRCTG